MVQLSLLPEVSSRTLADQLAALVEAPSRTHDADHRFEAARVTAARFRSWAGVMLSDADCSRVRAYYRAVLRRRVLAGRDSAAVRARHRLVAASIEADLRAAGWHAERAAAEAQRITGHASGAEAVA